MKARSNTEVIQRSILIFLVGLLALTIPLNFAQERIAKDILEQQYRIRKQLNPSARYKIDQATQVFLDQAASAEMDIFYEQIAADVIEGQFENLSGQAEEILSFYIICQATSKVEEDMRLITHEIESMNQAKEKLDNLVDETQRWIEEESQKPVHESDKTTAELQEHEQTPILKMEEDLAVTPNYKMEYPKMPEISYPGNLAEMSLSELEVELYRLKVALNSLHEISKTGIDALSEVQKRRLKFLQSLTFLARTIAIIPDSVIKDIK